MGLIEYSTALGELDPDVLLTSGDRYEMIATTIAASYLHLPVIHMEGCEITGSIDDKVPHATTKISDYHFVSTDRSLEIVKRLGEYSDRVYRTGGPSTDICKRIIQEDRSHYDLQPQVLTEDLPESLLRDIFVNLRDEGAHSDSLSYAPPFCIRSPTNANISKRLLRLVTKLALTNF